VRAASRLGDTAPVLEIHRSGECGEFRGRYSRRCGVRRLRARASGWRVGGGGFRAAMGWCVVWWVV